LSKINKFHGPAVDAGDASVGGIDRLPGWY